jgi:hypothetical protein
MHSVRLCTQAVPAADILGPAGRERAGLQERRANADAPETASNAKPLRASIHPGASGVPRHGSRREVSGAVSSLLFHLR